MGAWLLTFAACSTNVIAPVLLAHDGGGTPSLSLNILGAPRLYQVVVVLAAELLIDVVAHGGRGGGLSRVGRRVVEEMEDGVWKTRGGRDQEGGCLVIYSLAEPRGGWSRRSEHQSKMSVRTTATATRRQRRQGRGGRSVFKRAQGESRVMVIVIESQETG